MPKTSGFIYSDSNKRYHTFDYYLKKRFGRKVAKAPLNAGFTCPNRDGTKGIGGCTYCSELLSGDFGGNPHESIFSQLDYVRSVMERKWGNVGLIAYFQAGTNTYGDVGRLRKLFFSVLSYPGVVGVSVSTRPDCINDEIADMLGELDKQTYLTVELGLQTVFDETARRINRCHTFKDFLTGYEMLKNRGINVCVHIIDGLPYETHDMMVETARRVGELNPHEIKIHMLNVLKGTKIAEEFNRGDFTLPELSEYVQTVCDQLEVIPPRTVIGRLTGDGDRSKLIAPMWTVKKTIVLNEIDKELARRNTFQGNRL